MAKTKDKHLKGKTSEHIYREHHGLDVETGKPLPGRKPHHSCKCDDCKAHRPKLNVAEQGEEPQSDEE